MVADQKSIETKGRVWRRMIEEAEIANRSEGEQDRYSIGPARGQR